MAARWCGRLWTCAAIAAMSITLCAAYKYDILAHPQNTEVSASEHKREYYSERYQYHKWSSSNANSTKSRSENGTLKIINIIPSAHHNQREDSSRVDPTALQSSSVQTAVHRDSIVFPGEQPRIVRRNFVPVVTDECKQGETFCLNVPNYPEEYINSLLSNSAEEWSSSVDQLPKVKINQRIGEDPDTFELCDSVEEISYPKAAQNKDNNWLTIINTPIHIQGLRVEVCRKENSKCHQAATFRLGMVATCKQKHVLREMRALGAQGQLIIDNFRIPSCCSCVVRYVDD